jgi:dTDP-4-dehydrorhamnose reductase|tara:strand:- start:5617 stop:6483 length:867 start_codon:yes stop_codon:yes gene_type:complete
MKVLLLGASGYMGEPLLKELKENSYFSEVFSISRNEIGLDKENHFVCDIKNKESFRLALKTIKPNVIIDMINFSGEDSNRIIEIYEEGILDSLDHYVVISSFFVYKYFDLNIYREKQLDILKLNREISDNYSQRKVEMECALYKSQLYTISSIVRLPYVFSHNDKTGRFQSMCKVSTESDRTSLDNKTKFSMISNSFAVNSLSYISCHEPCGIVDLANTGCLTSFEISEIICNKNFINSLKSLSKVEDNPYMLAKSLCIETNKVPKKSSLVESIKYESERYFRNSENI